MTQYTAFISDLDGTLVNTEPLHADAWLAVLSNFGLYFDDSWFDQWIGVSDRHLAKSVISAHKLFTSPENLQKKKHLIYQKIAAEKAALFPDILPYLEKLHNTVPVGIATNSKRQDAEVVFRATNLLQYVHATFTADDVTFLKPAPDIYLKTARHLGVHPQHCVVCEDSLAGMRSAKAAGCFVIGIPTSLSKEIVQAEAHEMALTPKAALQKTTELLGLNGHTARQ